jgi:hypothetical protein
LGAEGKRRNNTFLQHAGHAMQAGFVGFSAAAMFVSAEYQKPFWIMVALTATVPTLLMQSRKRTSSQKQSLMTNSSLVATNL